MVCASHALSLRTKSLKHIWSRSNSVCGGQHILHWGGAYTTACANKWSVLELGNTWLITFALLLYRKTLCLFLCVCAEFVLMVKACEPTIPSLMQRGVHVNFAKAVKETSPVISSFPTAHTSFTCAARRSGPDTLFIFFWGKGLDSQSSFLTSWGQGQLVARIIWLPLHDT